jgi:hypothetical protein
MSTLTRRIWSPASESGATVSTGEEEIRLDHLPPKSGAILEAVLCRGELPRGDIADIIGIGERQGRRLVSALLEHGGPHLASTRAATPRLPRRPCLALDAGIVPGEDGLGYDASD